MKNLSGKGYTALIFIIVVMNITTNVTSKRKHFVAKLVSDFMGGNDQVGTIRNRCFFFQYRTPAEDGSPIRTDLRRAGAKLAEN